MPIPRSVLDDQQSLDANEEWRDAIEGFTLAIQMHEDVPVGIDQIEDDDYYHMDIGLVRADVREWLEENSIEFALLTAFYENPEAGDKAEWYCNVDLEPKGPKAYFDAYVAGEFKTKRDALMFKLRWGGE